MPVHSEYLAKLDTEARKALEKRLLDRQTGKCFIDDEPIDLVLHAGQLEIDHIIPLANGGPDDENNFALTHAACNRAKGASDLRVARRMSIVNVQGAEEGVIEDALAELAYELRGRLGAGLDDAISRWVLDTSIRSDLAPASNVVRLALALAASIQIGTEPAGDADKAAQVRREALLDACRAMLSSFWQQYREDASSVGHLVWALRGLRYACRKEGSPEESWGNPNPAFVEAILARVRALMGRLAACPDPDVRAEVATALHNFSLWRSLPPDLQTCLAGLSSDARARVRHAAHGGE